MQTNDLLNEIDSHLLCDNIAKIRNQLEQTHPINCKPAKLIAVTKTVGSDVINQLLEQGLTDIAENRAQVALPKLSSLKPTYHLHWIGRLQTNKVKSLLPHIYMLHSLDRLDLAQEVNRRAGEIERILPVLIQVNIARESQKAGLMIEDLFDFLKQIHDFSSIQVSGLMAIMPADADEETLTPLFHNMKLLFNQVASESIQGIEMNELSMGMSRDYLIAAKEGATMVRIGRALFQKSES